MNPANSAQMAQINAFLQSASDSIACGPDCQQQRRAEKLKQKMVTAKEQVSLAEPEYETAKRNYYTYTSGSAGYTQQQEKESQQKATAIVELWSNKIHDITKTIQSQIQAYNEVSISAKEVDSLLSAHQQENKLEEKRLFKTHNDAVTNDRKTYYENQYLESMKYVWTRILYICYFILVAIYCSYAAYHYASLPLLPTIGKGVFLCVLPFVSTWIIYWILFVIYKIISILPSL